MISRHDNPNKSFQSSRSHATSDSFISATDSPDAAKRQQLDLKLRKKQQKKAQKQFDKLKNEKNLDKVGREFGNLADLRASDPVTIAAIVRNKKKQMSASMMVAEEAEENKKNLKNVNENYFNRHFAHTP